MCVGVAIFMGVQGTAKRHGTLEARFDLRAKLGEGGMGVVYRAWDRELGKEVALKRLRDLDTGRERLLKTEFRSRAALHHKNLVQLFELVIEEDDCFLTMELVQGTDLLSWVRGGAEARADETPVTAETVREGRRAPDASEVAERSASRTTPRAPRAQRTEPLDAEGLARLRSAVSQLCTALEVLHAAGIVHRDVTPSNVRVTPSGHVVLLDFGLALTEVAYPPASRVVVAGTPRYMSPEQVRAEKTTSAADMYAVGGILYELVAGRSAFGGSLETVQVEKAAGDRPPAIPPGSVDDDLAALAMTLLDPEPSARPDAREVLRRLAVGSPPAGPTFGLPPARFVGRERELAAIDAAVRRVVTERRPRAIVLEGASGMGKTTLVKRALADLGARDPQTFVLASRCDLQEAVPFKALDAAMDALAVFAARQPDLGAVEPLAAYAALRLFPVLRVVPELRRHPPPEVPLDDADVRERGFEALRDLMGRLATRGTLVLWIDDVQWDDADSVALLEAVLRGRNAPALLLLLGLRTESHDSALVRRLHDARGLVPVERIALGPLRDADVESLAAESLGASDARVARVVAQSAGNPFLAGELVRYVAAGGDDAAIADRQPSVHELVAARLRDLSPSERALLAVTAVAVRPLAPEHAMEAAGLGLDARTSVLALRDALLLRQGTSPEGETIAPYHDKIAEAAQRLQSGAQLAAVHRALAEVIGHHAPDDADALCVHWEGAHEPARAAVFAYRAAENAAVTLAFERAGELYEKAIALGYGGVERAVLFERAAAAHANSGHVHVAAGRYLDASRALGDDARDARVRTLKRLAAEQYVKGGYVRHGWGVMRSVLDAAGIPQPASAGRATLDALLRRLRFLARRIDVDAIGDRKIPEAERARLEILWTASTSMSMVNVALSDAFRTMHLQRILDVGDASSIARALAYEVALEAHVGGGLFDRHAARLLTHARKLVDRTRDPYDRAWLELGVANQAFCAGRFRDAVAACRASERILREECRGVAWEISTVAAFLLSSLAMLGDLPALREASERFATDAERRGDLFGVADGFGGECVLAWWTVGSGREAFARAADAVARQAGDADAWPEKNYRRGQLTQLMATVHLSLLEGDPWPAWTAMLENWSGLKAELLLSLQFYRSWLRHGRARAALACAERLKPREVRDGWSREALLADARRMQIDIAKDARPFGPPWAALVEAALAHAAGNVGQTRAALGAAIDGFQRAEMSLYREAARYRWATLAGAEHERDEASAWMRAQGVPDVGALVDALVPGFGGER